MSKEYEKSQRGRKFVRGVKIKVLIYIYFFTKKHKVQLKLKRLGNCYGMGVHGTNHSKGVLILKMKLSSGHAIAL